nr:hypothetical protein [Tanacetum cinerariifolium]
MVKQRDIISFHNGVSTGRFSHNTRSADRRVPDLKDLCWWRKLLQDKPFKNAEGWKKHEDHSWKGGSPSPVYKHLNPKERPTLARKKADDMRTKWGNPTAPYNLRRFYLRNTFKSMKKIRERTNPLRSRSKNAGATYQRLVNTIFEGQMGRNLEAYVDDMVIKSKIEPEMIKDVEETLLTLKKRKSRKSKRCSKHALTKQPEANATAKRQTCRLKQIPLGSSEKSPTMPRHAQKGRQAPIHYVRRTLQGAEINYPPMEKLALALVHAARRLRRKQREDIMAEDNSTQVKTKELNDTLAKGESMQEQEAMETKAPKNLRTKTCIWKLYTEGASNEHGSKARLILIDPEGAEYSYALRLNFSKSNNDAEYEALLAGLRIETKIKVEKMHAFVDSKLVASQAEGSYEAKGTDTHIFLDGYGIFVVRTVFSGYDVLILFPSWSGLLVSARIRSAKNDMISVTSACPFQKWGMDIVGPLPEAPGKIKYLIVAVDYFTKWFGISAIIIIDNETQLINDPFKSWAEGLGIQLVSTSIHHSQANEAMKRANRSIMQGIKTRLHQEG